jgi:Rps23 Pro-64 3,4-dihydroxylase Tpa1-like proline 4-hydroxylase
MYDFKCTDGIGDEGSAGGLIDSVLLNEDRQVRGKELSDPLRTKKSTLSEDLKLTQNSSDRVAAKSQYRPSTLRLDYRATLRSRHPHSVSSTLVDGPKQETEWSNDKRRFKIELQLSIKDLEQAKNQQDKSQTIADARIRQIIQEARRKIARNERIKEEVRQVKNSISEILEYQDILNHLEAKNKRAAITAKNEQARITQSMRISVGRSEKWKMGPALGPGPVSQLELNAACISEDHQELSLLYNQQVNWKDPMYYILLYNKTWCQ